MPGWVGWDGDGMGREGMSWDGSGVGAGYHVEKHENINRLLPTNHTRASLWLPFGFGGAACGTLGLLFVFLFVTWGVLVPSGAKAPKRYEKSAKMGAGGDVFLIYLSADEH